MTNQEKLVNENLYEFYDQLAQAGDLRIIKDRLWTAVMNEPGFWPNVAYRIDPEISSGNAINLEHHILTGEFPRFMVVEDMQIDKVSGFWRAYKFHPFGAWRGMILDMTTESHFSTSPAITIEKPVDGADLEMFLQIVNAELIHPAAMDKSFLMKIRQHPAFELYLLKEQGVARSTIMVFKTKSSYGLYLIATDRNARQKGFGRMLVSNVINQLSAEARKPFILHATPSGEILYTKLGFLPVNRFFLFRHVKN